MRLATDFVQPRGEIDRHVGMRCQQRVDVVEVLGKIGHVRQDELGVGMVCDKAVPAADQFPFAWEAAPVGEAPRGVLAQRVGVFVTRARGLEETVGVGLVNQHRYAEPAGLLPNGREPLVIDGHQFAPPVAVMQPEFLEDLEAARAPGHMIAQQGAGILGEGARVGEERFGHRPRKGGGGEGIEAVRMAVGAAGEERVEVAGGKAVASLHKRDAQVARRDAQVAREIACHGHADTIHRAEKLGDGPPAVPEMVVGVDRREGGAGWDVFRLEEV